MANDNLAVDAKLIGCVIELHEDVDASLDVRGHDLEHDRRLDDGHGLSGGRRPDRGRGGQRAASPEARTGVTDNNSAGTYTQVDTDRTGFSTTGVLTVWVRTALITAASSTIFTAAQVGSTGGGLHVYRLSGMTLLGASAVRSSGGQSTGTSGTTPAPVLSR